MERGISFPAARKAALSEPPTNAPRQTAASVVSTANFSVIQSKCKQTATVSVQTELTWPVGTDTRVPVKVNSQSTQTTSQQKNTTSPSPPPRSNKAGNAGKGCLLYTSPSPRDRTRSRMPSSA